MAEYSLSIPYSMPIFSCILAVNRELKKGNRNMQGNMNTNAMLEQQKIERMFVTIM